MSTQFDPGEIKIEGEGSYESDVVKELKKIESSPVGLLFLQSIDNDKQFIFIKPYTGGVPCNARTESRNPRDSAPKDVKPFVGRVGQDPDGRVVTRESPENYIGTGKGSDANVNFSPSNHDRSTACSGGKYGSQPDEVLFHELVHGLRNLGGLVTNVPCTSAKLYRYFTEEECGPSSLRTSTSR